jgi:hypothetical protein
MKSEHSNLNELDDPVGSAESRHHVHNGDSQFKPGNNNAKTPKIEFGGGVEMPPNPLSVAGIFNTIEPNPALNIEECHFSEFFNVLSLSLFPISRVSIEARLERVGIFLVPLRPQVTCRGLLMAREAIL